MTPGKIRDLTGIENARVAVVLGSGLGTKMITSLVDGGPIPYSEIDGMPPSTVPGHEGSLYFGDIAGTTTLLFSGRAHLYEGHDARQVTFWVRATVEAGCDTIVLTNAPSPAPLIPHSKKVSMPVSPGPRTRRRPKSRCSPPWEPISWACQPFWRRSRPDISGRACWGYRSCRIRPRGSVRNP